jgi:hypothetical protein
MGRCLPWRALILQNEKQSYFAGFRLKTKTSNFIKEQYDVGSGLVDYGTVCSRPWVG